MIQFLHVKLLYTIFLVTLWLPSTDVQLNDVATFSIVSDNTKLYSVGNRIDIMKGYYSYNITLCPI